MNHSIQCAIRLGSASTTLTNQQTTYQSIPYCGKPINGHGPYYINPTEKYVKKLVVSIPKPSVKGRNISMNQLYMSISTAKWHLEKNITCVGTMVTSRIGLPNELKVAGACEEFENILHWEKDDGDLSLCTYTKKFKSKGKKNVLELSTMPPLVGINGDDGKLKSAIIKLYDFTKGELILWIRRFPNTPASQYQTGGGKFLLYIGYHPMKNKESQKELQKEFTQSRLF